MQTVLYGSPLGEIILSAENGALTGLWFAGQRYECAGLSGGERQTDESAVLLSARRWLDGYFSGRTEEPPFPVSPAGSEFRRRVWAILRRIPYGQTLTYAQTAQLAGCASARAVGNAVGHNPVSIVIPCHRVVNSNGKIGGYAGGVDKKLYLLRLEGAIPREVTSL